MLNFESDYNIGCHPKILQRLNEKVVFCFWEKYDENHTVVRFATSWATKMDDVEKLEEIL